MGAAAQPPKTRQERESFARNPALAEAALGLPSSGVGQQKQPTSQPKSTRAAPETLLGASPASNARSTGRSLIKDPVGAGSLLR
jgi:hypothetical protein